MKINIPESPLRYMKHIGKAKRKHHNALRSLTVNLLEITPHPLRCPQQLEEKPFDIVHVVDDNEMREGNDE